MYNKIQINMIYNCWFCGWRINERHENYRNIKDEDIGKVEYMYDHHPFCSDYCVDMYKKGGKEQPSAVANWYENGVYDEWKKTRKIGRIREKRR